MQLQNKTRSIGALILFILILAGSSFLYVKKTTARLLDKHLSEQLHLVAAMKADHVALLLQGARDRVIDFSSDGKIKDTLHALHEHRDEAVTTHTLIDHLRKNKLPIDTSFYEVYALDIAGTVVASTNMNNVGISLAHDTIYSIGKEKPYVKNIAYDSSAQVTYFNVSAPVIHEEAGFVGVIAIKMLPDRVNALMLQQQSDDVTESYIINNERYLVTPSAYLGGENKGVLTQIVETKNAFNCIQDIAKAKQNRTPIESVYTNYAGKKTPGLYAIIEELQWCIIVEKEL